MSDERKSGGLFGLLLLDLVGAVLFTVGAVGVFGGEGSLLPREFQFTGHNFLLMTVGIALILPYALAVIRRGRAQAKQ